MAIIDQCTGFKPPKTAMLIFNTVKTSYFIETKSTYFGQNGIHYIILFDLNLFQVTGWYHPSFLELRNIGLLWINFLCKKINRQGLKSDSLKSRLNNHSMLQDALEQATTKNVCSSTMILLALDHVVNVRQLHTAVQRLLLCLNWENQSQQYAV